MKGACIHQTPMEIPRSPAWLRGTRQAPGTRQEHTDPSQRSCFQHHPLRTSDKYFFYRVKIMTASSLEGIFTEPI